MFGRRRAQARRQPRRVRPPGWRAPLEHRAQVGSHRRGAAVIDV